MNLVSRSGAQICARESRRPMRQTGGFAVHSNPNISAPRAVTSDASVQIDAELSRPLLSRRGQLQELVVASHQLALAHALEQSDSKLSGEMVVADSRSPKRLVSCAASGFPIRSGDQHQALQNFGDLDRRNAKVSVTTLSCARDEPRLLQFLQVAAGR